jgi:hypothetical protein
MFAAKEDTSPVVEDPSPREAPSLAHMPASVAEAIHFVTRKNKRPTTSGPLSYEDLIAAYNRLQESSSVVADLVEARAEQPNAPEQERISAINMFGKRGSATRLEAMTTMKAKHDEKLRTKLRRIIRLQRMRRRNMRRQ